MLSANTVKGEIAYGVIAGTIWLVWMAVIVLSHVRSKGTASQLETGEKLWGKSDAASSPDRYAEYIHTCLWVARANGDQIDEADNVVRGWIELSSLPNR